MSAAMHKLTSVTPTMRHFGMQFQQGARMWTANLSSQQQQITTV